MGTYASPDNEGFSRIASSVYVDKTGLISHMNDVIGSTLGLVCVTRPRRFGKTFAAESLVSYYSCGCDSRSLFDGLGICRDPSFLSHLNAYNVVHLNMTSFRGTVGVAKAVRNALLPEPCELCQARASAITDDPTS